MQLSMRCLLLLAMLVGCVKFQPSAPLYVKDIAAEQALIEHHGKVINGHYIVKKGDTLYSIGFKFEQPYKTLARWNGIKAPYHLEAGQKIALFKAHNSTVSRPLLSEPRLIKDGETILTGLSAQNSPHIVELPYYVPPPPVAVVIANTNKPAIERSTPVSKVGVSVRVKPQAIIHSPSIKETPPVIPLVTEAGKAEQKKGEGVAKASTAVIKEKKKSVIPVINEAEKVTTLIKKPTLAVVPALKKEIKTKVNNESVFIKDKKITPFVGHRLRWQWPVKGKILKNFYQTNKKGVDIASDIKQDVKAAESGIVVYSGNGLVGYGNLLIIKHNETFLSAYGNNSELLVKEGQAIKRGQVIALIGVSVKTGLPSLHFEIRKEGKSVDPMGYLN